MKKLFLSLILCGLGANLAPAQDWPQWRGPNRDNKSTETNLLKSWPETGPKLLWQSPPLAAGFAPVAVANGTIYLAGNQDGQGRLFALDLEGKPKWQQPYGRELPKTDKYAPARNMPTIDGPLLFLMSSLGDLVCLDSATGTRKWGYNVLEKFGGQNIKWKICESLLVDGQNLIVTPGGAAGLVALNKQTGALVWKSSLQDNSAYCSPILMPIGSRRLLLTQLAGGLVGLDPTTGKPLWKHPYTNRNAVHANTPVFAGTTVFSGVGYGHGGVGVHLSPDGQRIAETYLNSDFAVHHGGQVLVDGHVYAAGDKGALCMELASGRTVWGPEKSIGKGSITYADGRLYCYSENGKLSLVKASPQSFSVLSSFNIPGGSGPHWAHPVIAGGRLYIRRGDILLAYDIQAK